MTVFKIPGVTDAASIMCLITSSLSSDLVRAAEQGEGRVAFWGGRTCTAHPWWSGLAHLDYSGSAQAQVKA